MNHLRNISNRRNQNSLSAAIIKSEMKICITGAEDRAWFSRRDYIETLKCAGYERLSEIKPAWEVVIF